MKKIAVFTGMLLFLSVIGIAVGLTTGVMVIDDSGHVYISMLAQPSPLPLDPNDPVVGAYLANDDTSIYRFYGDGTYVFKSLIHPSTSNGSWGNLGDHRYSLSLSTIGPGGTANSMLFSTPLQYSLSDGVLTGSSSDDIFNKISANPDEPVQSFTYPTTSPQTPINRQVGVDVKRVSPGSISVTVLTGNDVSSLVSIRVVASGKDAVKTGGRIEPRIGSVAYYAVEANTDIVVVAEFYDYTHYNVWAGKI